jgi:hypothetical protein
MHPSGRDDTQPHPCWAPFLFGYGEHGPKQRAEVPFGSIGFNEIILRKGGHSGRSEKTLPHLCFAKFINQDAAKSTRSAN